MRKLVVGAAGAAAIVAILILSRGGSGAQEAAPVQRAQIVAALDITPITQELGALRAEMAGIQRDLEAAGDEKQRLTALIEDSEDHSLPN